MRDLAQAGYLVPESPEVIASCAEIRCSGCDQHWLLMVYGSADKALAPGGREDIKLACSTHGAIYDGGGMLILPDEP